MKDGWVKGLIDEWSETQREGMTHSREKDVQEKENRDGGKKGKIVRSNKKGKIVGIRKKRKDKWMGAKWELTYGS